MHGTSMSLHDQYKFCYQMIDHSLKQIPRNSVQTTYDKVFRHWLANPADPSSGNWPPDFPASMYKAPSKMRSDTRKAFVKAYSSDSSWRELIVENFPS